MANKLQDLATQYLYWREKEEKAQKALDSLKEEIIVEAKKKKIKRIKSGQTQLIIVTQSETRFPRLNDPQRKEVEKIVRKSGELEKATVFDIIRLGNAYDERKLSKKLKKQLQPYTKRIRTTKIVVNKAKKKL